MEGWSSEARSFSAMIEEQVDEVLNRSMWKRSRNPQSRDGSALPAGQSILLKINIPPRPNKRAPAVQPLPEPRIGRPPVVHEPFGDAQAEGVIPAGEVVETESHVGAVAVQFDLVLIGGHIHLDRLDAVPDQHERLEPAELPEGIFGVEPGHNMWGRRWKNPVDSRSCPSVRPCPTPQSMTLPVRRAASPRGATESHTRRECRQKGCFR